MPRLARQTLIVLMLVFAAALAGASFDARAHALTFSFGAGVSQAA